MLSLIVSFEVKPNYLYYLKWIVNKDYSLKNWIFIAVSFQIAFSLKLSFSIFFFFTVIVFIDLSLLWLCLSFLLLHLWCLSFLLLHLWCLPFLLLHLWCLSVLFYSNSDFISTEINFIDFIFTVTIQLLMVTY